MVYVSNLVLPLLVFFKDCFKIFFYILILGENACHAAPARES